MLVLETAYEYYNNKNVRYFTPSLKRFAASEFELSIEDVNDHSLA